MARKYRIPIAFAALLGVWGLCPGCQDAVIAPGTAHVDPVAVSGDGVSVLTAAGPPAVSATTTSEEGPTRRHTETAEGGDHAVDVSADGKWIVFASTRHAKKADLYLKRVGAASVIRRTDTASYSEITPKFSPDGLRVAFASDRMGSWDLYVVSRDRGRSYRTLTATRSTDEIAPAWNPKHAGVIAYCARPEDTGEWEIRVMDENRSGYTVLGPGLFPEFSPDGARLIYQRARARAPRLYSIWAVDVRFDAAGNFDLLRPTEIISSPHWAAINPCFSPDGKFIAFSTVARSPESRGPGQNWRGDDIWIASAEGGGMKRLTAHPAPDYEPVWAAAPAALDASATANGGGVRRNGRIYFTSLRTGFKNIWSIQPVAAPTGGGADKGRTP